MKHGLQSITTNKCKTNTRGCRASKH